MQAELVRRLGQLTETLHAVVYFAPEPSQAYANLGLRGYWRGYFASRTAAVGTPSAPLAVALLGGFAPRMVARAVPEVWTIASPAAVQRARTAGASAALRRLLPAGAPVEEVAAAVAEVVDGLGVAGRPMAAAHAALPRPADPVAALWHGCTVLREHRGDGHLAAVTAAGLSWPVPHLLAAGRLAPQQQDFRGWSDQEWSAAARAAGALPDETADRLEAQTDAAATTAYGAVDAGALAALLEPLATAVAAAGEVPFPNAMGLLRP